MHAIITMFFSNDSKLLKVKFSTILIMSIIFSVMAVPLPMNLAGIMDDAGRFGTNAAKNSGDVIGGAGKVFDTPRPTDDIMGATRSLDDAQNSVSKMRNAGLDGFKPGKLPNFADDTTKGKKVDSASSASKGQTPITLPGTEIPLEKLRLGRMMSMISDGMGKYLDWRKKAGLLLSESKKAYRTRAALMTEDPRRIGKLLRIPLTNYKSWLKLNKARYKTAKSFPKLKPASGPERIARMFPIKSFKSWITRFEDLSKGLVERVQKFRQNRST